MDYRVEFGKEIRPVYPGMGIRPVGQKEGRGQNRDFKEALREKQEESLEKKQEAPVQEGDEMARELHEETIEEKKGIRLNIIA